MIDLIHRWVQEVNTPLWNGLIFLLLGTGLFFTLATGFVQFRLFGRSVREMLGGRRAAEDPHGITPFQAFVTGLASRVGVGNIAGVAIAIANGGPGAVFWMWVTALIGMSSAFAESSLAQLFKIRDHKNGHFRGGPAYYIRQGLKQNWMAVAFSLSLIFCFGLVYNAVQSNTMVVAAKSSWGWNENAVGVALVILTAPIIFGGIRRVSRVAEMMVPVMAVLYLLMALYIVGTNLGEVPRVFGLIFGNAFTLNAAGGGFLGGLISIAMEQGIKRGLYSNEAGQGSAPNAAAAADVKHPVSQGMIQMLGVFVDTLIVCSCTAFIVLLSDPPAGLSGVELTQAAIVGHVGAWGADFLTIMLFLFAFSTIIGNYAYAESNIQFINGHWLTISLFRMAVLGMVYFGAVAKVPVVWDMADLSMGIMALINLIAILLLSPLVFLLLKDYTAKLRMGRDPQFKLSEHPSLKRRIKSDIW
ncbi:AGSC family alanine:sodium (Na+) symporter [Neisseria bacilliformis ATCC BAA-1200]|uniref:AGSC family alanine:sodium (Na+) symporter n=1 Tax=Neisseria bacilliformis ATCC BAA-1200 TaxID=888742 RepID=F2BA78_9NEIS|nr:sodium:alanine symporter family protein [Neisseria bacilliformis]EGF11516.1 AGSC family alanine:sodium (Na+) symporter [Neisseria bacilliformis ATCC BAA-1200]QMT47842.1 sodium:alanine symporter family protein [Neisseria bacilliformis]